MPHQKAVIATGAQQPSPMRPEPGSSEAAYMASLVKYQQDFKQATKVVIAGGGSVGLELAGVSGLIGFSNRR
jgi:pyruvate/2-oxoglutarate dehydrogenase complex dihydrolipoamide dehydrogenase (E3) component